MSDLGGRYETFTRFESLMLGALITIVTTVGTVILALAITLVSWLFV